LVSGSVRVLHTPRQAGLAREVMEAARTPFALPGLGRLAAPDSTTIVLAATPAAFTEATGGGAPEWAGGVAIPSRRLIVLPTYPSANIRQADAVVLLRHEIAHLVLAGQVQGPIPRWFQEGYAEVASGGWDVEGAWQLRVAFVLGGAPPLDSLALGWPRGADRARFAYLLSATAVDFLWRRAGERGMEVFFRNWREEESLDGAMRVTFGWTLGKFEDEWRADVKRRYGWLSAVSNLGILWLGAALLALALWIPRRRRNRARMDEMRREERMLMPPREDGLDIQYPIGPPPRDD
jgi:LPXTG-motif cell wall-anchored protein